MSALHIAGLLAFAFPVLATEPPKPAAKPPVKRLYMLGTPHAWLLDIHDDGSGVLTFGDGGGGNDWKVPAGTFQPDEVRKTLDKLKLDPKGLISTHFSFHYEEDRKGSMGPKARYTQDEAVVTLFEKAKDACVVRPGGSPLDGVLRKRPGFGLKE